MGLFCTPAPACMQVAFLLHDRPDPKSATILINMNHQVPLSCVEVSVHHILQLNYRQQAHMVSLKSVNHFSCAGATFACLCAV